VVNPTVFYGPHLTSFSQIGFLFAAGIGKSTCNEQLVEYYLRAAGVAKVWIHADGHVGAQDLATLDLEEAVSPIAATAASTSRSPIACASQRPPGSASPMGGQYVCGCPHDRRRRRCCANFDAVIWPSTLTNDDPTRPRPNSRGSS
jgi:hypothetical protein